MHAPPWLLCSYAMDTTDAGDSLPHPQALHPTLPGPDRFRCVGAMGWALPAAAAALLQPACLQQ